MKCFNLGFLASGNGSNIQAIIDAYKQGLICSTPKVIISNNSKSFALQRGQQEGLVTHHISSKHYPFDNDLDNALIEKFEKQEVNLIILAGYMKKVGTTLLEHYKDRVLNIHPALLPKYGGEGMYGSNVHQAVFDNKEKESGATVHLINQEYDKGRILNQDSVSISSEDTPEIIAQKVLKIEHKLYYSTIRAIEVGQILLD